MNTTKKSELSKLLQEAKKAAEEAQKQAAVAELKVIYAKEARMAAKNKAAELVREEARIRIRYLRAAGAEVLDEGGKDDT